MKRPHSRLSSSHRASSSPLEDARKTVKDLFNAMSNMRATTVTARRKGLSDVHGILTNSQKRKSMNSSFHISSMSTRNGLRPQTDACGPEHAQTAPADTEALMKVYNLVVQTVLTYLEGVLSKGERIMIYKNKNKNICLQLITCSPSTKTKASRTACRTT